MSDNFEQYLRHQPPRTIPSAWREEILAAADANRRNSTVHAVTFAATLRLRWRELFWPCPQAWACLAAVWLVILAANLATRATTPNNLARQLPPSPQMRELLRQQEQLFAELVGPKEDRKADRPKTAAPQPRSSCRDQFMNV